MNKTKAQKIAAALRAAAATLRASEDEDTERFNDRLNDVPDLESAANAIMHMLAPLDGIDDEPGTHAQSLVDALSTAVTVETEADLDANLKDALKACGDLSTALKAAKSTLRGEDDADEALEAIAEALAALRSLVSDIKNV